MLARRGEGARAPTATKSRVVAAVPVRVSYRIYRRSLGLEGGLVRAFTSTSHYTTGDKTLLVCWRRC